MAVTASYMEISFDAERRENGKNEPGQVFYQEKKIYPTSPHPKLSPPLLSATFLSRFLVVLLRFCWPELYKMISPICKWGWRHEYLAFTGIKWREAKGKMYQVSQAIRLPQWPRNYNAQDRLTLSCIQSQELFFWVVQGQSDFSLIPTCLLGRAYTDPLFLSQKDGWSSWKITFFRKLQCDSKHTLTKNIWDAVFSRKKEMLLSVFKVLVSQCWSQFRFRRMFVCL